MATKGGVRHAGDTALPRFKVGWDQRRFERRPTMKNFRELMVSRRGEALLVPPYILCNFKRDGAVTLVMACLVTEMWIRSIFFGDLAVLGHFQAVSQDGTFSYALLNGEPDLPPTFVTLSLWMKIGVRGQLRDSLRYIHPGAPVPYATNCRPVILALRPPDSLEAASSPEASRVRNC